MGLGEFRRVQRGHTKLTICFGILLIAQDSVGNLGSKFRVFIRNSSYQTGPYGHPALLKSSASLKMFLLYMSKILQ